MTQTYDLIIIGGGQAGLAAAYYAQQHKLQYLVLEAHETIGQSWRDRYDSLTLFTPRAYSNLPGMPMTGNPEGYPTKDEVSDYFYQYVQQFGLAVSLGEKVISLVKEGAVFRAATDKGIYESAAVVVATGPFQTPRTPDWHTKLGVQHLHSADYRNPNQIAGNKVLVVGGGNSGAQIAEELTAEHEVTMAVAGSMRFMPAKILGKSLFWWLDTMGLLNAPASSFGARLLRKRGDPVIGTALSSLIKQGRVTVKPSATDGKGNSIVFADGTTEAFDAVVWCTGYTLTYPWLQMPRVLDEKGQPLQAGGISSVVEGLYFLGLGWMRSRNSALVGGVGNDAKYLLGVIKYGSTKK
jgi:putative flavoprotein involved in K+ transport